MKMFLQFPSFKIIILNWTLSWEDIYNTFSYHHQTFHIPHYQSLHNISYFLHNRSRLFADDNLDRRTGNQFKSSKLKYKQWRPWFVQTCLLVILWNAYANRYNYARKCPTYQCCSYACWVFKFDDLHLIRVSCMKFVHIVYNANKTQKLFHILNIGTF